MLTSHPSLDDFQEFLRGGASRATYRRRNALVMRHLLMNCEACHQRLETLGWSQRRIARLLRPAAEEAWQEQPAAPAAPPDAYDYSRAFAAAERSVSAVLAPEPPAEVAVDSLLAELDAMNETERVRRVTDDRYAVPGLIRALIDRSHGSRYQDVDAMLHWADLARLAAEICSPAAAGGELRFADLRARAWGQYANALRVSGKPREAEESFVIAQRHRKSGTADPVLRAWLAEKMTPMAIFHGRFEQAVAFCEEAGEVYREIGEGHLLASTLVQKAIAFNYAGEEESAIRTLNQAIPLIDYEEDPHLLLAACHNLIRCYIDLGRPEQALQLYSETREIYQEFNDPLILLRAGWQEGQLLRDLGHLRAAESALLRSRKGYMEKGLAYEAALVSLDLATVYVKLGLVNELKETVTGTVPIFRALRVELETLAALRQLQQVADQEQQALELIRSLNARIQPLPRQPAKSR